MNTLIVSWVRNAKKHPWLVAAYVITVLAAILVRYRLIGLGPEELTARLFTDDSFFYHRVAEQIVNGHGSTFDGIHPTNGYHPLWVGVLTIIYRLFPHAYLSASLVFQACMGLLAGLFLWKSMRMFTRHVWVVWAGVTLFLLSPRVVFFTLNGMETPLYIALLSIYLFLFFRWALRTRQGVAWAIWMGSVGGLLVLARSESLIILAITWLVIAIKTPRARWKSVGISLIVPLLILVVPLLALNYSAFGQLSQMNAYAPVMGKRLLFVGEPVPSLTFADAAFQVKQGLWEVYNEIERHSDLIGIRMALLVLLGVFLLLWGIAADKGEEGKAVRRQFKWFLVPLAGLGLIFFLNSFVRWYQREYYSVPWNLFIFLFVVLVWDGLLRLKVRGRAVIITLTLILMVILHGMTYRRNYRDHVQYSKSTDYSAMQAAQWANAYLPDGARLGSFKQSGVVSYWSRFHVENLDGKINNTVFPYLMRRDARAYLEENGIRYLVEPTGKLQTRQGFFGNWDVMAHATLLHRVETDKKGNASFQTDVYEIHWDQL